jgi:predicted acylesterase/phospholipase RssA
LNASKLLPDLLRKDNSSRAKSTRNGHNTHSAPNRRRAENRHSKVALVLAGGGIMGVVYEIGALRAINDMLVDLTVNDFDIFVGTSAGALVTSFVANGYTPHEIMQFMDNRHPEIGGVRVGDVFHANLTDYARRLMNLPRALLALGYNSIRHPGDLALSDLIWEFTEIFPSGLYDGNALERFVRRLLELPGHSNRFDFLEKQLYVVATELDTGNRAVFGQGGKAIVPISRAVAASSAVPVLYRPVEIFGRDYVDGGLHGTASLDLAIEAGAKLVICINPMVPLNARRVFPNENYISGHGLPAIINQAVRTLLHSSLRYHIKNLQVKYPDVDIVLIQPEWDDQRMFSYNPMYYGSRLMLAEHGFETVTSGLLAHYDYYRQVLKRHGIEVHTDFVQRELAAMQRSGNNPAVVREVIEAEEEGMPTLTSSLDRLEANLARLEKSIGA